MKEAGIKFRYICYLFIASAALGPGIFYSKLYVFHVMLIVALSFAMILTVKNNFVIHIPKLASNYHYFFIVLVTFYFVSTIWSLDKIASLRYVCYNTLGVSISLSIIYFVSQSRDRLDKVFKVLSVVFISEVVICLLEALTPFRWPWSPYSPYVSIFGRTSSDFDIMSLDAFLKPTGFQWNPNNMAITHLILFPFFILHSNRWIKYLGSLFVLINIIFSGSRGCYIGFIVMMLPLLFFYLYERVGLRKLGIISLVILMMSLAVYRIAATDNQIKTTLEGVYYAVDEYARAKKIQGDSVGIRKQLMWNGWAGLLESYGIGVGGGASPYLQRKKGGVEIGEHGIRSMHNYWFEVMVEGGFILIFVYILWYFSMFKQLLVPLRVPGKIQYYRKAMMMSLIGFIFGAISASSVVYFFPMWIMYGFAIATINVTRSSIK